MIIVYTKEKFPKYIFDTIFTKDEVERNGGLFVDHEDIDRNDCIIVESQSLLKNPISDDLINAREMTREELILLKNKTELLQDGEIIEDGAIKKIEVPANLIRPIWNKDTHTWQEGMTKEELMLKRKDLIMQYKEIKTEIETLEEFSAEFESDNTIVLLREQMSKIKKEIDDLLVKIKQLA